MISYDMLTYDVLRPISYILYLMSYILYLISYRNDATTLVIVIVIVMVVLLPMVQLLCILPSPFRATVQVDVVTQ